MTEPQKPGADLPQSRDRAVEIDLAKADLKDVTPDAAGEQGSAKAAGPDVVPPSSAAGPSQERSDARGSSDSRGSSAWPVAGGAVAGAIFGLLGANIHQTIQAPPVTVADPRVAQVEVSVASAVQAEKRLQAEIKALEARAKAAEDKAAAAEQRAVQSEQKAAALLPPLDGRIKATEDRIAEVGDRAGALARQVEGLGKVEAPKIDLGPLETRLDGLEKALGSNSARLAAGTDAATALDGRIKRAEQALNDLSSRRASDAATATLATTMLVRRALDGGEALGPHVAALRAQGVADALLRPLAPYTDKPAPRADALVSQLAGLAANLPRPAPAPAANAGLFERIKAGLLAQVDVRATGAVPADAAPVIGRARGRLVAGDPGAALSELRTLNSDQQAHLKPLMDAVAARMAAFEAVRLIEAEALAATARKS